MKEYRVPSQAFVDAKRANRMAKIDALPPELRELVHEYNFDVVRAIMDCGVMKPARIRHIVETVLDAFSPTRGSSSNQGPRKYTQEQKNGCLDT